MCWFDLPLSPFLVISLLFVALIGGYCIGKREPKENKDKKMQSDNQATSSADDELSAESVPAPCSSVEAAGIAPVNSKLFDFATLSQLSVTGCWQVKLECNAHENYCCVTAESVLWKNIKAELIGGGLEIRYTGKRRPTLPMTIEIKTKSQPIQVKGRGSNSIVIEKASGNLLKCKVAEGGRLLIPGAAIDEFKLKVSDSSQAECRGDFALTDIDLAGSSSALVSGKIKRAEARVSGASRLDLAQAERVDIALSGASKAKVDASESLEGDVSGASSLKYGNGVKSTDLRVSGSSKAKPCDKNEE